MEPVCVFNRSPSTEFSHPPIDRQLPSLACRRGQDLVILHSLHGENAAFHKMPASSPSLYMRAQYEGAGATCPRQNDSDAMPPENVSDLVDTFATLDRLDATGTLVALRLQETQYALPAE
jgi:hypothetical protein